MSTGITSYKRLYNCPIFSIESVYEGFKTIVKNNKKMDTYTVLIIARGGSSSYTVTKNLFLTDEVSIDKAMLIVKAKYRFFMSKYFIGVENISLEIRGRVYISDEQYQGVVRKKVYDKLDSIQNKINSVSTNGNTNTRKFIFDGQKDISQAISKIFDINTRLYLHNNIYKYRDSPGVSICDYYDKNVSSKNNYEMSRKITITNNDTVVYSWIDHWFIDVNSYTTIERFYDNNIFVFEGYPDYLVLTDFEFEYKFPSIRKTFKSKVKRTKIGVIDTETYTDHNTSYAIPYAIGFYVDNKTNTYYIGDENCENDNRLVSTMMKNIIDNYRGYVFYVHNLDYDGIYLMKAIMQIVRDPKRIKVSMDEDRNYIKIVIKTDKGDITILDSYKIVRGSLDNRLSDFGIPYRKGIFPYTFMSKDNLFYKGDKPDKEYYPITVSDNDYNNLPMSFDRKADTIRYLENDLICTHRLISAVNDEIFKQFKVDMTSCSTLASLSFSIYLTNYYKRRFDIKVISGSVEKDIRDAYYGGILSFKKGIHNNYHYYDVNSLYPSVMLNPMPVGNPTLVSKGRVPDTDIDSKCTFVYRSIMRPNDINAFIPYRTSYGDLVYPNNEFSGWYFADELYNAEKLGYRVHIEGGYKFNSNRKVFSSFVLDLYEIKKRNVEINPTLTKVVKLLMNSLYGKMGRHEIITTTQIIETSLLPKFNLQYNVLHDITISDTHHIVVYVKEDNSELLNILNISNEVTTHKFKPVTTGRSNRSIPIAAAITAYGRINMGHFARVKDNTNVYIDTDSLLSKNMLERSAVGKELGQMKYLGLVKKAVILAPKVYRFEFENGQIITKRRGLQNRPFYLTFDNYISLYNGAVITITNLTRTRDNHSGYMTNIMKTMRLSFKSDNFVQVDNRKDNDDQL